MEQVCFAFQGIRAEGAQCTVVVEDENTPPESAEHKVVLAALDGDVAHRNGREASLQRRPFAPSIGTGVDAGFGAQKKE